MPSNHSNHPIVIVSTTTLPRIPLPSFTSTTTTVVSASPVISSTSRSNTPEMEVNVGSIQTNIQTPIASSSSAVWVDKVVPPITPSVQLPTDLTPDLNNIIAKIKKLSYVTEWLTDAQSYNFFRQRLIELEKKSSEIPKSTKNQIYSHLSSYLPFSESELKRRANNEVLEVIEMNINAEFKRIKRIINYWKPEMISFYTQKNTLTKDLKDFPWNKVLSIHLHLLIGYKINLYNRLTNDSNSETNRTLINFNTFFNDFFNNEIKPIWPTESSWLSLELLRSDISQQAIKSLSQPLVNPINSSVVAETHRQSTQESTQSANDVNKSANISNEEVIVISDDSAEDDEQEVSNSVLNIDETNAKMSTNTSQTSAKTSNTLKTNNFKRLCVRLGHISCVYCIAFDRTGKFVFTGSDDYLIKIWSIENGCRLVSCLRGHQHEITDISVNYENTILASGDINYLIIIWSLKDTKCLKVLKCHSKQITSLKFCPLSQSINRYLVSTGDDGRVCFWRYNSSSLEFQTEPDPQIREQHSKRSGISCSSFSAGGHLLAVGSTDSFITVYKVDSEEKPKKIFEQNKHWGHVDRIHFCNNGLHFVSSSNNVWNVNDVDKDNAFIWNFHNGSWNEISIKVYIQKSGEYSYKKLIIELCWTRDDEHIITSLNDFSIKIWNSKTGQLVQVLEGHTDEIHCIQSHPIYSHIFLSAGYDTKVILWNLKKGKIIKVFNSLKGRAILDASFSPNGSMFGTTDCYGRLSLFGTGSDIKYKSLPEHMFFHTDYHPLVEIQNILIDDETKLAPHLLPIPFLVDINGARYPPKVQQLVPGREDCFDCQNEPYVCLFQEKRFILDPVVKPEPVSHKLKNISSDAIKIKDLIEILGNHMTRSQMFDILFLNFIKLLTKKSKNDFKKFFEALVRVVTSKITVEDFYDQLNQYYACPHPHLYIPILKYCLPFFKPKSINEIFSESISAQTKLRILEGLEINAVSEDSLTTNNLKDSQISLDSYTPITWNSFISISQSLIHSKDKTKDNVLECLKYLSVQLMLASIQPLEVNIKICSFIQSLINGTLEVDDFITKFTEQFELRFAKQDYLQFLKQTLPQIRYLMTKDIITIANITSPLLLPPNNVRFRPKRNSEHNYSDLKYEESADKRTLFLRDKSLDNGPYPEKGWKVAKKQLLRRPGNWVSYHFDKTWDVLWSERDAVIQLSSDELNAVYEQLKQNELKEINIFHLKSLERSICDEIPDICDSNNSQNQTPDASHSNSLVRKSKILDLNVNTTPSQSTRSKFRSISSAQSEDGVLSKRRKLRFSTEGKLNNSRTKSTRTSNKRAEDTSSDDNQSDANSDFETMEDDDSDNDRQTDNNLMTVSIGETSTEEQIGLKSIPNLDNLEQNGNRMVSIIKDMKTNKPIVKEVETQTAWDECRCESETQTEPQIGIKLEIKSEFMANTYQVKQESEANHYLCVFCRQSSRFDNRKEAFDHYRRHLALVIRCELCFVNFSNTKSFSTHNIEHSKSAKNSINVRNYCLSLDWIDSFLDFQMTDKFRNLFLNFNDFCPVCSAIKLNNKFQTSAQTDCAKHSISLAISNTSVEHLKKHLNFDTILQCIQCIGEQTNRQNLKFYFSLTDAQNHLYNLHDLKHNFDNCYEKYFNTIEKLSPNLDEFFRKCSEVCKCINDLYETNSID